jgi:hypothetical protein
MTKASLKTSGTSTTKGASVLFFGVHWSFTIMEPSGKGCPLPGTPALNAVIMVGLATITLSTFVGVGRRDDRPILVSPEVGERDSARRFQRVVLTCLGLARKRPLRPRTASAATAVAPMVRPAIRLTAARAFYLLFFCSCCSCAKDFLTSSGIVCSPSQTSFLSPINVRLERLRLSQR